MHTSYRRIAVLAAATLAAGTTLLGPASPATAAADPTATIGDVSCVDADGSLSIDLHAADASASTFVVMLDGSSAGDDHVLDAGSSEQVPITGLEDGDHTVEVLGATGEEDFVTLASAEPAVACDVAPVGPYTNVKGSVVDSCGFTDVTASNKVIAGNAEDLQPVDFVVAFTPTDDEPVDGIDPGTDGGPDGGTDGGTDETPEPSPRTGAVGVEQILDSFTLDAAQQTYERTFSIEELGTGDLTLRTGDTVVATSHTYQCVVLPVEGGAGGGDGPALPNTGF